jgi:heme/copper-type cytochrome/quinol oxidase subunit 3
MLMLLGGETMFFGGLVIAFLQLRLGAADWPPAGQPRLPIGLTAVNTLVLLASSWMLVRALRAVRAGDQGALVRRLGWTWALGRLFLFIQGVEWTRLVHYGLGVSSGIYGATFYTLIGVHGVHVLGAVAWLGGVLWLAWRGRFTPFPVRRARVLRHLLALRGRALARVVRACLPRMTARKESGS